MKCTKCGHEIWAHKIVRQRDGSLRIKKCNISNCNCEEFKNIEDKEIVYDSPIKEI